MEVEYDLVIWMGVALVELIEGELGYFQPKLFSRIHFFAYLFLECDVVRSVVLPVRVVLQLSSQAIRVYLSTALGNFKGNPILNAMWVGR